MSQAKAERTEWNTGLDQDLLKYVGEKSVAVPSGFVRIRQMFYSLR